MQGVGEGPGGTEGGNSEKERQMHEVPEEKHIFSKEDPKNKREWFNLLGNVKQLIQEKVNQTPKGHAKDKSNAS